MLAAWTYDEMLRNINDKKQQYGVINSIVGILFTRPNMQTGKDIMNNLEYFYYRSGSKIDFTYTFFEQMFRKSKHYDTINSLSNVMGIGQAPKAVVDKK